MEITKEKFDRYELVRESGRYNMIMDAIHAMAAANLTRDEYMEILKNHAQYREKFYEQ